MCNGGMHAYQLGAVCMVFLLVGCATTPPSSSDDLCRIFLEKPKWYRAAKLAQETYGAPVELQMAVIQQESNFRHDVRAPRKRYFFGLLPGKRISSAYGYSQALDGTWLQYVRESGVRGARRDHFDDSVFFVAWYLNQTRRRNGVSYSNTVAQYLNYHEGWGGYSRGTHKRKAWLLQVAGRVESRRLEYARQMARCELPSPGFFRRLFG